APALTSLAPDEGPVAGGTLVTITGTDLSDASAVTIDGASVPFTQVSSTEITFVTPPHAAGAVDVVVTTPGGPSNALPFTYLEVPALTSLAPDEGPTAGGTLVTITGTDLAGATEVTIDGASVPFTQVSATEVTFVTPPHAAGAVDVVVTTPGGESNALPFTYVPVPAPTSLNPDNGPETGGTTVTIIGTDLGGATSVTVDGVEVPFTQVSDTEITFVTPPHAPGEVDIVVTTPGGPSAPLVFTYTPVTTIDGVTPPSGPTTGGTQVTISGHCFTGATGVLFGSKPATSFRVVNDTTIVAVSPAGTGKVDVTVIGSASCGTAILPGGFTYIAAGASAGGGIAATGIEAIAPIALGGIAIVLGMVALFIARRRRLSQH
ncbi:IPT/TIG domain-containing protein, partial [Agromyces subbeticus]|uniref:IPT/TIG domain-containing protein n=1 Tax=Agromyces subbeticus TaxID=293890 RepID=UPI0003B3D9B3